MANISTPQELETALGESLKALRLQKNLSRQLLSERAGISENALRNLEGGKGTTLKTFVRVVKALDRTSWLEGISPIITINPLHMIQENQPRQRAGRKKHGKKEKN